MSARTAARPAQPAWRSSRGLSIARDVLPGASACACGGACPRCAERIDRQPAAEGEVCSKRTPLYGWDNIRNLSRERLRAAGFVFCGPDRDFGDPALWERWVHPSKGVLHFQVKWKDDESPAPAPGPDKPDDRQKRCADPCTSTTDNQVECKKCCEDSIPAEDTRCRRSCDFACSLLLDEGPTEEPTEEPTEDDDQDNGQDDEQDGDEDTGDDE